VVTTGEVLERAPNHRDDVDGDTGTPVEATLREAQNRP
jgi:hypothetical protein